MFFFRSKAQINMPTPEFSDNTAKVQVSSCPLFTSLFCLCVALPTPCSKRLKEPATLYERLRAEEGDGKSM